jgi:chromosomal replication initiation ATPase DnaA
MLDSAEPIDAPYPDFPIEAVIDLVAREKNVPPQLLTHKSRCRARAVRARHLAMYLSHVVLGRSLSEIAEEFGRDRTTVSYACGQIEDLRDDPAFDAEVARLELQLESADTGGENGAA